MATDRVEAPWRAAPTILPKGMSISDNVTIGVLVRCVPARIVDEVLKGNGRQSLRQWSPPACFMTYYVMAMALYFQDSYLEVQRKLLAGLQWLSLAPWPYVGAGKPAITMARQAARPGTAGAAVPGAWSGRSRKSRTRGAWYRGRRLVAWDGTPWWTPRTSGSIQAAFGRPSNRGGCSGGLSVVCALFAHESATR